MIQLWAHSDGNPWFTEDQQEWTIAGEQADPYLITVGQTVYMFYRGRAANTLTQVGVRYCSTANYPNGPWVEYPNNPIVPVFNDGSQQNIAVNGPARVVQMPDGSFRMYTHANDGTHEKAYLLTTSAANFPGGWSTPVEILTYSAIGFDSRQVALEAVVLPSESPDGLWHFFFNGYDGTYWLPGHATSVDGIALTKDPNNPMSSFPLVPGSWMSGAVYIYGYFKWGGYHHLILTGKDGLWLGEPDPTKMWRTGISRSTDLVNWTTPVLITEEGPPGWALFSPLIHHIAYDAGQGKWYGWGEGSASQAEYGFGICLFSSLEADFVFPQEHEVGTDGPRGNGSIFAAGIAGFLALAAATLTAFSSSGVGVAGHTGVGVASPPAIVASVTATHQVAGTASASIPSLAASASGLRVQTGTGAGQLSAIQSAVVGGRGVNAAASLTLPSPVVSAQGTMTVAGPSAAALTSVSAAASGSHGENATGDCTLSALTASVIGNYAAVGEATGWGAATLPAITAFAEESGLMIWGTGANVLPVIIAEGQAALGENASATASFGSLSASATGQLVPSAAVGATLPLFSGDASGVRGIAGASVGTISALTASTTGDYYPIGEHTGTAAASIPSPTGDAVGEGRTAGPGAAILPTMVADARDYDGAVGTIAGSLSALTASGSGRFAVLHAASGSAARGGKSGTNSRRPTNTPVNSWRRTGTKTNSNRGR